MNEYETLNHTTWDCKYHVVFYSEVSAEGFVSGIAQGAG